MKKEVDVNTIPQYRYDAITILSNINRRRLLQVLPIADLRRLAPTFTIIDGPPPFWLSKVAFTMPSDPAFLDLLHKHEHHLRTYRLTEVEVARDVPCTTEHEAIHKATKTANTIRRRWSRSTKNEVLRSDQEPRDDGHIQGAGTYYVGDDIKVYARRSKPEQSPNLQPIVRTEITLHGSSTIRRRLGIHTIDDLPKTNLKNLFDHLITTEALNMIKIGKLVDPKTKNPIKTARAFARGQAATTAKANSNSNTEFINELRTWDTSSKWRSYLKSIRSKSNERGAPTWQKRIKRMSRAQINNLFTPTSKR